MSGETTRPGVPVRALLLLAATVVTLMTLGGLRTPEGTPSAQAETDSEADAVAAAPGSTPGEPATVAQDPAVPGEDPAAEAVEEAPGAGPEAAPGATPDGPMTAGTPLQVRIGSIAVDAPVVPVGLEDDGAMEIPERVAEIGWYDPDGLGVEPGATGTAVLAGHVDSRSQGRGALYDLRELRTGETIEIDLADGTTQRWLITEVIQYPKDVLPLDEIFTWAGESRLAIITCGGEFDRTARSYTDNIVVYAEPLQDPSAA